MANQESSQAKPSFDENNSGCPFVLLLGLATLFFPFVAIYLPGYLSAIPRGKQKRTLESIRTIGGALERFHDDHHHYPITDFSGLKNALSPKYIATLPELDGWKNRFAYESMNGGDDYILRSAGADGAFEHSNGGEYATCDTTTFTSDIAMKNGQFIRAPSGKQSHGDSRPDSGCEK